MRLHILLYWSGSVTIRWYSVVWRQDGLIRFACIMAYIGHPVVNDPLYGYKRDAFPIEGQALHSCALDLVHPITKQAMHFEALGPMILRLSYKLLTAEVCNVAIQDLVIG